jgi:hypothetical protein
VYASSWHPLSSSDVGREIRPNDLVYKGDSYSITRYGRDVRETHVEERRGQRSFKSCSWSCSRASSRPSSAFGAVQHARDGMRFLGDALPDTRTLRSTGSTSIRHERYMANKPSSLPATSRSADFGR